MVRDLVDRFYSGVTRYTTSAFLRTKFGDAFNRRAVAPHIYESAEEASAHLRELEGKGRELTREREQAMNKHATRSKPKPPDRETGARPRKNPAHRQEWC